MRNIEPPFGRGSATKFFEIFARRGCIAAMNSDIGAWTLSLKRCLLASNHGRSLCAFRSRKKAKKSLGKPSKVSAMSSPSVRRRSGIAGRKPSGGEPGGERGCRLAAEAIFVQRDVVLCQHRAPAGIGAGVEERFVAVLPGETAARHQ